MSLTPRAPPHDTAFISSIRIGLPLRCETATYGATDWANPYEEELASSCAIVTVSDATQCLSG